MAKLPHFVLNGSGNSLGYTSPGGGGGPQNSPPRPERHGHGTMLLAQIQGAQRIVQEQLQPQPIAQGLTFLPLEFAASTDFDLMTEQLEGDRLGIKIINAREEDGRWLYTVAVPNDKVVKFTQRISDYMTRDRSNGTPLNENLCIGIGGIAPAFLEQFWTDISRPIPATDDTLWWEVWLRTDDREPQEVEAWFRTEAGRLRIVLSPQRMVFPERLVILAYTSLSQWQVFPSLLLYLAEFRKANLVAGEFTRLTPADQGEFIAALRENLTYADNNAAAVCVLDTGTNRGHPLLENSLGSSETQTWNEEWGSHDHHGHGTGMAGLALFGPLTDPLYNGEPVQLVHRLESVKILPPTGQNSPPDYAPITLGAMAKAELAAPHRNRVFCLAVTSEDGDRWQPTLWSAGLDQATSGQLDGTRRLVIVSAGNIREKTGENYPDENHVSSIEDPGQSWNALTVGAYTGLTWLEETGLENYTPIAPPGGLSPASRTSLVWGDEIEWPYKPDVVCEGGNYAIDKSGFITTSEDLELLTTQVDDRTGALLGTSRDTSAATAQVARMGAILQAEYPQFWPETVRGLIAHSAEWTPQMQQEFPYAKRKSRLRVYGLGVPDLERARHSAEGIATMVIQDDIQPYHLVGSDAKTKEMRLHALPLPVAVLQTLGETEVRMRVTLSYFIEPNPPRRGYIAQYRYASHGLRFSVQRPGETIAQMQDRITSGTWPAENQRSRSRPARVVSDDRSWDLGEKAVVRGSLHSDAWTGTAATLALCGHVAIYPVTGWWRERVSQSCVDKQTRYSLIVTISTAAADVDLYTAVQQTIAQSVVAATEVIAG